MIKMIVSDIDGTLVPFGGKIIPERTKKAIRACVEKGVKFVPASGRILEHAAEIAQGLEIDCPIISSNGGRGDEHPYDSPVFEDGFDKETARKLYDILFATGCYITSYAKNKIYVLLERNGYGSECVQFNGAKPERSFTVYNDRARFETEGLNNPYKFEVYTDNIELLESLNRQMQDMGFYVSRAFPFEIEIMPRLSGKGRAVTLMAQHYGIAKDEIMALGDGSNDIGMLESAGVPVAMGNAVESLKRAAKIIAPPVDEDGAAYILEKYVLEETDK